MNCSRRTTYFHCRIVFHTRIVPGTPRISVQDRFSTRVVDDLFRAHHIVSLQDRFSTRWIYRSAKIYHLRIVFQRDELFQARITYFHCRIAFLRILESTRWIVPGARRISTAGSFFNESYKNCSRHTTYFISGSFFYTSRQWFVSGTPHSFTAGSFFYTMNLQKRKNIPLEDRFSTRWIVSGTHHVFPLPDRFSKNLRIYAMNCSRRTTYFHCRIVFHTRIVSGTPHSFTAGSFFYCSARWIVSGAQKYSISGYRSSTRWIVPESRQPG